MTKDTSVLRLLLLRHAKSDWGDPGLEDIDRPLSNRGRNAARAMGAFLEENHLRPDLILCSTAQRTRETLSFLLPNFKQEAEIRLLQSLYDQSGADYIQTIRAEGGATKTLMLIGHNPAIEDTAHTLYMGDQPDLRADMELKYPSGALTVYDCPIDAWKSLTSESCHLEAFIKPRSLQDKQS
ncbi:SixA phosphatase family protein [Roseibium algae]|uniref:Histidine phosphatase family protein n=1 Tax=Roseibium algae TaxID=3123038 RepID=A0ABU8TKZ1_9HYPH